MAETFEVKDEVLGAAVDLHFLQGVLVFFTFGTVPLVLALQELLL